MLLRRRLDGNVVAVYLGPKGCHTANGNHVANVSIRGNLTQYPLLLQKAFQSAKSTFQSQSGCKPQKSYKILARNLIKGIKLIVRKGMKRRI
jgi:hypothetical protein